MTLPGLERRKQHFQLKPPPQNKKQSKTHTWMYGYDILPQSVTSRVIFSIQVLRPLLQPLYPPLQSLYLLLQLLLLFPESIFLLLFSFYFLPEPLHLLHGLLVLSLCSPPRHVAQLPLQKASNLLEMDQGLTTHKGGSNSWRMWSSLLHMPPSQPHLSDGGGLGHALPASSSRILFHCSESWGKSCGHWTCGNTSQEAQRLIGPYSLNKMRFHLLPATIVTLYTVHAS